MLVTTYNTKDLSTQGTSNYALKEGKEYGQRNCNSTISASKIWL